MNGDSETSMRGEYRYTPLPDPASYIRLVEVFEADGDQRFKQLRCRLSAWSINEAPPYHAISYTWGEEGIAEDVSFTGEASGSMGVRKNLANVLRRLLYFDTSRYYWIDAVCINQHALDEKGHQVALMGSVFKSAKHVLVYLGDYENDDKYAMGVLLQNAKKLYSGFDLRQWHMPLHWNHEQYIAVPIHSPHVDNSRYASSLASLSWRPYFSRVWVVQELVLAKNASILCGDFRVPLEIFRTETIKASMIQPPNIRAFGPDLKSVDPRRSKDASGDVIPSPEDGSNKNCIDLLYISSDDFGMDYILSLLGRLQCYDPRDRIYGGLALIETALRTPMEPDYSMSVFHLAVQILEHGLDMQVDVIVDKRSDGAKARRIGEVAKSLLTTLGITAEDPDLQDAIAIRQRTVRHTGDNPERRCSVQWSKMLTFHAMGWQLSRRDAVWRHQQSGIHIVCPGFQITQESFFWVPLSSAARYWLIEASGIMALHYLLVKQIGDGFAIVGKAEYEHFDLRPPLANLEEFVVSVDAEDCLVSVSLSAPISTLRGLPASRDVRFCWAPMSSFAQLERKRSILVD